MLFIKTWLVVNTLVQTEFVVRVFFGCRLFFVVPK